MSNTEKLILFLELTNANWSKSYVCFTYNGNVLYKLVPDWLLKNYLLEAEEFEWPVTFNFFADNNLYVRIDDND